MKPLLAALLLLPAWALGCGTTAPALHPDVLLVSSADGSRTVVRSNSGDVLGRIPAGLLAMDLSGGDDIAEAYLVAASGSGTTISSVQPSRGYALSPVAAEAGRPGSAALLPAPGLTTYVGRKTVLVVYTLDGSLTGYQHGTRLWSVALGGDPAQLVTIGDRLFLGRRGGWAEVSVGTGAVGRELTGIRCDSPGPLAVVDGVLVSDCVGLLDPSGHPVPDRRPAVFRSGAATMLAFPDGEVWRLQGSKAAKAFEGPSWTVPPAPSLDGSRLFVPTPEGVEVVDVATGRHHSLTTASGANPSLALSRDGDFVYALAGGVLRSFHLDTGARAASVTTGGVVIERVVGG